MWQTVLIITDKVKVEDRYPQGHRTGSGRAKIQTHRT
jgi:hypothetical protein